MLDADLLEREELSIQRISEVKEESLPGSADASAQTVIDNLKMYFDQVSEFLLYVYDVKSMLENPGRQDMTMEELQKINHDLYRDILPENYEESFGNPSYAVEGLGTEYGPVLSFLYAELRCAISYAYERKELEFVSLLELFLEVYSMWSSREEAEGLIPVKSIKDAIYYYMYDYADVVVAERVKETLLPAYTFARDIIMESDLEDLRYLYAYGEFIGSNEIGTARYLSSLPEEDVIAMARTYVNGFVRGFETMRIDLKPKKTVNIRYAIGQERMVRYAIEMFEAIGLAPVIFRYPVSRMNRRLTLRPGFAGTPANKQYDYDHRMDEAIFYNRAFMERKLEVMEATYEQYKEEARVYAGPAVIEVFGENPFAPENKDASLKLSEKQQAMSVEYSSKSAELINRYIPQDQYSFTIIAYPIPEIGENFREIFDAVVEVNNLDNERYQRIQQSIIDCLDDAEYVQILGQGTNQTDMRVYLHEIDRTKETNFENCLADVNIPLGEVFTSPRLTGTKGVLHVSQVYLNELKYTDLKLTFEDGRVSDYTCKNFEDEAENRAFIKENLLFNHSTLPMGEFAIGTNTVAYAMAQKYDILYKLPILIVEKMGPHFAVGDTCYSHSEDSRLYNPDGREIVAKENECSVLRRSEDEKERAKAYYNCHTDITIPYEEIGGIYAVRPDQTKTAIIEKGRFVLPGTEELNRAFRE